MAFLTPQAYGEKEVLKTYALQQLAQLRTSVHGLTDEQARSRPAASVLSLVQLLLHCGGVAVWWSSMAAQETNSPDIPERLTGLHDLAQLHRFPDSLEEALAVFDDAVGFTADQFDAVTDTDATVPPFESPWLPKDLAPWQVRWMLTHISTEVARHCGHADIIRETIDGKGSYQLNDEADREITTR